MKRKLRAFIWDQWATDYTSGVLVVLAYSVEGARRAYRKGKYYCDYREDDLMLDPRIEPIKSGMILADVTGGS